MTARGLFAHDIPTYSIISFGRALKKVSILLYRLSPSLIVQLSAVTLSSDVV